MSAECNVSVDPASNIAFPCSGFTIPAAVSTCVIVALLILSMVFGNGLVIVAVVRTRRLRLQLSNYFIVSLAVADLLVAILVMPFTLAKEISGRWLMGEIVCELWLALDVLFVTASILNLCLISLDRYLSITKPISYLNWRTVRRTYILILAVWLLALLISFPPLVGWRVRQQPGECDVSTDMGYVLYSALGSFYLPMVVLVIVYSRLYKISKSRIKQKKETIKMSIGQRIQKRLSTTAITTPRPQPLRLRPFSTCLSHSHVVQQVSPHYSPRHSCHVPLSVDDEEMVSVSGDVLTEQLDAEATNTSILLHHLMWQESYMNETSTIATTSKKSGDRNLHSVWESAARASRDPVKGDRFTSSSVKKRYRKLKRRELRNTLVLGVVLLAFVVCWAPFFLLYVFSALFPTYQVNKALFTVIFWLGYCNSALNPPIYTLCNQEFRSAFGTLLCKQDIARFGRKSTSAGVGTKAELGTDQGGETVD